MSTRRSLATSVLASGLGTAGFGAVLLAADNLDGAVRVAGSQTLAFGAVNGIVGGVALAGIAAERERWESAAARAERRSPAGFRRHLAHALDDERREATAHGINLGMAAAYAAAGGAAVLASRFGPDHPDRWLAAGSVLCVQAAHLAVIDLVGMLRASGYHRELADLVQLAVVPGERGVHAGASLAGSF